MAFLRVWRPRTQESRRRRVVVGAAAVVATFVLAIGFPFSALLSQHRQLSAAAAQLSSVRRENQQLSLQAQQLSSKTEIERRARQDFQLVQPGQTLFALLPGPGAGGSTKSAAVASGAAGDPGGQPLVPPSQAADLAPDPGLPSTTGNGSGHGGGSGGSGNRRGTSASTQAPAAPPTSFLSRVVQTLEFWH